MKKILVVGEDFALLGSRASLLAKTGAAVTCCNAAEFAAHLNNASFDLVILCNTLDHKCRRSMTNEVRRRWPHAQILILATGDYQPSALECDADAVVMSLEPEQLLRTSMALLNKPSRTHPASRLVTA